MKYLILTIFKFIFFALIIGITFQYLTEFYYKKTTKYPGQILNINGNKIHFHQTGLNHGPTVVLDMGMGGNLLYWSFVQQELSKFARVISYDRPGLGWSEAAATPRSSENIVQELHNLLQEANIAPPYILVGHSFAGINARIFTNKYPDKVLGLVLVDSSHPDQLNLLPKRTDILSLLLGNKLCQPILHFLTFTGITRAYNFITYDHDYPEYIRNSLIYKNSTNSFIKTLIDEWNIFAENLDYAKKLNPTIYNKPLIVITAGKALTKEGCKAYGLSENDCILSRKLWMQMQDDLAKLSENSTHIIAQNSGHIIPADEPMIIVDAVKQILGIK